MTEPHLHLMRELALTAASGLVVRGEQAWVVADNCLALHAYDLNDLGPPQVHALTPERRPAAGPLPKKVKPDLEALYADADGSLVALGSGSRANRSRGYAGQTATGEVRTLELAALHDALRARLGEVNLEGAVRAGDALLLAHRGLRTGDPSQLVVLDAGRCRTAESGSWPPEALRAVVKVPLGTLDGVQLGFTDLALHPTLGLHFLAAAERTGDAYLDGAVAGSVFGRLDNAYRPTVLARLRPDLKCEGLAWWKHVAGEDHWLVVTDADDPGRAAQLRRLRWPAEREGRQPASGPAR